MVHYSPPADFLSPGTILEISLRSMQLSYLNVLGLSAWAVGIVTLGMPSNPSMAAVNTCAHVPGQVHSVMTG